MPSARYLAQHRSHPRTIDRPIPTCLRSACQRPGRGVRLRSGPSRNAHYDDRDFSCTLLWAEPISSSVPGRLSMNCPPSPHFQASSRGASGCASRHMLFCCERYLPVVEPRRRQAARCRPPAAPFSTSRQIPQTCVQHVAREKRDRSRIRNRLAGRAPPWGVPFVFSTRLTPASPRPASDPELFLDRAADCALPPAGETRLLQLLRRLFSLSDS